MHPNRGNDGLRLHRSTRPARLLACIALLPVLSPACARPKTFDAVTVRPLIVRALPPFPARPVVPAPLEAADRALAARAWLQAVQTDAIIRYAGAVASSITPPAGGRSAAPALTGFHCGGDYPPCYVADRESHNTYDAFNANGCGGSGCYGRWQFSGAWAGKLGLPSDLSTATPEQQDEAARQLWNGGAGCSNWDAC